MSAPLYNPDRTAAVLRQLITDCRAEGLDVIRLDDLESAMDTLEQTDWRKPRADPD